MPLGYKDITGLTQLQGVNGLIIASIPGDSGMGPDTIVLQAVGRGLPPNDLSISITLAPGPFVATGSDVNGVISVTRTLTNTGDDKTYDISGGGQMVLSNGVWQQLITNTVNYLYGTREFHIQFLSLTLADFTQTLTNSPTNPSHSDDSWDSVAQKGQTKLHFTYSNSASENPKAVVVVRNGSPVGSIPWTNGVTSYDYTDYVFVEGTYTYTFQAYKYGAPNQISPPSSSIDVTFGGASPDINVTMDLTIDIDWVSTMLFITDPSGIYTLIPGQTFDRLYQRTTDTFLDVAIPNPFVETAFVGK